MKEIIYNKKKYKMPFGLELPDDPLDQIADVTIKNRFSGQECTMPCFAAAVYDVIIGAEMLGEWQTVRKGLDWFKQYFAEQYMVVLD